MMMCVHPRPLTNVTRDVFREVTFLEEDDINRFVNGEVKEVFLGGFEPHPEVV